MKDALGLVAAVAIALSARAEDSIAILRNGTRAPISDISASGVSLAASRGKPAKVESLSQIKDVSGPLASKFEANRSLATDLWRAAARLERGDEGGAEPLFEQLWHQSAGVSGPTRAEIAAGLAACRVRRGAFATAVDPWLEWIRQSASLSTDQLAAQRKQLGISDSAEYWIDVLPPIWGESTAVRSLATHSVVTQPGGAAHPSADDLLLIYAVAARRDSGQPWQVDPQQAIKDPAWANLAGEMVLAESGNAEVRAEARQRLSGRLASDVGVWKQIWIRLALGRSLILEPGADDRRAGVLNLLWIVSREGPPPPLLATAFGCAIKGLVLLADIEGARSLLADAERRLPGDPVLDSPVIASARRATAQAPTPTPVPSPDKDK